MADQKISQLTGGGAAQATDEYVVARAGGNNKITGANVAAAATSVGTLTSLTVSGDLTVDTSTLKVDSTNNRVGIGTASPSRSLTIEASGAAFPSASNPSIRLNETSSGRLAVIELDSGQNLNIWNSDAGAGSIRFYRGSGSGTESMRLDASGNLGVGTTSPDARIVASGTTKILDSSGQIFATVTDAVAADKGGAVMMGGYYTGTVTTAFGGIGARKANATGGNYDAYLQFLVSKNGVGCYEVGRFDASGNLGIGTTSPAQRLDVSASVNDALVARAINTNTGNLATARFVAENNNSAIGELRTYSSGFGFPVFGITAANYSSLTTSGANSNGLLIGTLTSDPVVFGTNDTERMRIDASGNLGVGETSPNANLRVHIASGTTGLPTSGTTPFGIGVNLANDSSGAGIWFGTAVGGDQGIAGIAGTRTTGYNTDLRFYTNSTASARAFTERARITSGGDFLVAKTASNIAATGFQVSATGQTDVTVSASECMNINRETDDGDLIRFRQANTVEGSISVSSNTVSYNAFAGSHWSQLEDGSKPEILRGTVMEAIDELCEWPDETNERLPKAKVSDTAGSKKVYGVFMDWDNDWTETNDMYVTAVGAFICRVAADVVVEQGDLLESNGDGTARVQADDVIRSSTIGKVTSTVKTHEYEDGTYCVPTVLYCG